MTLRRGFTLIELIVVISVIAIMAGMAIPAIGLIKKKVADMQCGHNLQQIGMAIMAFRESHDDRFPDSLRTPRTAAGIRQTSLIERKDELLADMEKLFICPRDRYRGNPPPDENPFNRADRWGKFFETFEPGCSYFYEASGKEFDNSDNLREYFLRGVPPANRPTGRLTWGMAKVIQQRTGNYVTNYAVDPTSTAQGAPFPADRFPIIRCFHHYDWNKCTDQEALSKQEVRAASINGTFFTCSPFWEHDIDPRFKP